jgi:FixJ family two-component response regulator
VRTHVAAALAAQKIPFVFLTGVGGKDVHTRRFPNTRAAEKPYQTPVLIEAVSRAAASWLANDYDRATMLNELPETSRNLY